MNKMTIRFEGIKEPVECYCEKCGKVLILKNHKIKSTGFCHDTGQETFTYSANLCCPSNKLFHHNEKLHFRLENKNDFTRKEVKDGRWYYRKIGGD
jgi:hypothetical protein